MMSGRMPTAFEKEMGDAVELIPPGMQFETLI